MNKKFSIEEIELVTRLVGDIYNRAIDHVLSKHLDSSEIATAIKDRVNADTGFVPFSSNEELFETYREVVNQTENDLHAQMSNRNVAL